MPTRVAVVTGASRGIGAAAAHRLARDGYSVALLARDRDRLHAVLSTLNPQQPHRALVCDVGDPKQVADAFAELESKLGTASILVNNAGYGGPFHRIDEVDDAEWESVFATNVKGLFHCCRLALPKMREAGFGRVINIASIQAHAGAALSSTYVASKHAVVGYTRALAAEWARSGITCNAISPGYIATDMGLNPDDPGHRRFLERRVPAGRMGTPEEIAGAIAYLSSAEASYVNGAILMMDGGMLADATPDLG